MVKLTRQQEAALMSFEESYEGGEGSDGLCWMEGVRPWPTMSNLVDKGLATWVCWIDEDAGNEYRLTTLGAAERARRRAAKGWRP